MRTNKVYRFTGVERFTNFRGIIYLEYVSSVAGLLTRVLPVTDRLSNLEYVGRDPSSIIQEKYFLDNSYRRGVEKNFILRFKDGLPVYKIVGYEQHIDARYMTYLEMLD